MIRLINELILPLKETNQTSSPAVIILPAAGGSTSAGEGRQALRLRRVLITSAQPLRHAHLGLPAAAQPGRLQ